MNLPSASNTSGTFLGLLAGGAITASAPGWPFIITAAASLGFTPVALASLLGLAVTSVVNLGVTHFAEIKNLNDLVATWWPQIQYSYPQQKEGAFPQQPTSQGQNNANINKTS